MAKDEDQWLGTRAIRYFRSFPEGTLRRRIGDAMAAASLSYAISTSEYDPDAVEANPNVSGDGDGNFDDREQSGPTLADAVMRLNEPVAHTFSEGGMRYEAIRVDLKLIETSSRYARDDFERLGEQANSYAGIPHIPGILDDLSQQGVRLDEQFEDLLLAAYMAGPHAQKTDDASRSVVSSMIPSGLIGYLQDLDAQTVDDAYQAEGQLAEAITGLQEIYTRFDPRANDPGSVFEDIGAMFREQDQDIYFDGDSETFYIDQPVDE